MGDFLTTITEWNHALRKGLAAIAKIQIGGVIPLDSVLHFFIGLFITVLVLRKTKNYIIIFFIVFTLAIGKEYYDSFTLMSTWREHFSDIFFTVLYPFISFLIFLIKKRIEES